MSEEFKEAWYGCPAYIETKAEIQWNYSGFIDVFHMSTVLLLTGSAFRTL